MKLRFTPLALAEVDRILSELEARSPQGARNVRVRLRQVTVSVREFPRLGQPTDVSSVRRLSLRPYPYVLFYRIAEAEILVVGLRHGARDPAGMPDAGDL